MIDILLISNILFDTEGNFQWASIAAIIAFLGTVISALISVYFSKRTLKGNLISGARIEWIQEVRNKSVDFITSCYSLFEEIELDQASKKEISNTKKIIEKNGNLLILYFGPELNSREVNSNGMIVYLITNLLERINNKNSYYDENKIPELIDQVNVLRDFLRIYFKAEWKRANGELKQKEMKSYLNNQEVYVKIMEIFEDGYKNYLEANDAYYNILSNKYKEED